MNTPWFPKIDLVRLDAIEKPKALTAGDLPDKVRGMLLGVAIGDALGNRSESRPAHYRFADFGYISDYVPNSLVCGSRVGTPSDDTQLSFWTVEHLIEHGQLNPKELSWTFASREIFGMGQATGEFVRARKRGVPWYHAGQPSAGNGALMRIAPLVLPHLDGNCQTMFRSAAVAAAITHNDQLAIASAVAWVAFLWDLLGGDIPALPEAWLDSYLRVLRPLDHDQQYASRVQKGPLAEWRGSLSELLDGPVRNALAQNLGVRKACGVWNSGAYLLETLPTVLYILAKHGHEPVVAVEQAVNETWDNDTIASIVAGAMGAAYGTGWIPERWVKGLLGRTQRTDDGKVFALIESSVARFLPRGAEV